MIYDQTTYEKLQTLDKVLHLLLEDPLVQDRFKELATFEKLGGEVTNVKNLTAQMYQALSEVSSYIDNNRYNLQNLAMYLNEFMQLQSDMAYGYVTGTDYSSRLNTIQQNLSNIYFSWQGKINKFVRSKRLRFNKRVLQEVITTCH